MEEDILHLHDFNSSQNKEQLDSFQPQTLYPELFTGDSLLELCNSYWERSPKANVDVQPYLRGCKWSPDGTCCLSVVNNDGFHIMELPRDLYEGCPSKERMITVLPATIHVKEGGLVYDFCWYPKMNSFIPETCRFLIFSEDLLIFTCVPRGQENRNKVWAYVNSAPPTGPLNLPEYCFFNWITTKKNSPIQMWDAYDGSLRCSYRGFNAVDEMEPALSVTFTHHGDRIVAGYKKCIRTFDVERPGRDFLENKTKSTASCLASNDNYLAVGSWDRNIRLYSISNMGTYKSIGYMQWHSGGVTHIQFTPDNTKLVSGARKDDMILVWDLRRFKAPLNILKRRVSTNQRIYFDISACGRYLVSGGTDGVIRVWDEERAKWTERRDVKDLEEETATFRFRLHKDCCNSVSIHPSRPILATGSGQFHIVDPVKVLEQDNDKSNDEIEVTEHIALQLSTDESTCNEISRMSNNDSSNIRQLETSNEAHESTCNETSRMSDNDSSNVRQLESSNEVHESTCIEISRMSDNDSSNVRQLETSNEAHEKSSKLEQFSNIDKVDNIQVNQHSDCATDKILTEQNNSNSANETSDLVSNHVGPPPKRPAIDTSKCIEDTLSMDTDEESPQNPSTITNDNFVLNPAENNHKAFSDQMDIDEGPISKDVKVRLINDTNIDPNNSTLDRPNEDITGEELGDNELGLIDKVEKSTQRSRTILSNVNETNEFLSEAPVNIQESDSNSIVTLSKSNYVSEGDFSEMEYSSFAENNLTFWWIA